MKIIKFGILFIITFFFTSASILVLVNNAIGEDGHTRQLLGRTEISRGLPNKASYTTIEVFDVNGNGRDELYLGGAGKGSVKTAGIHAFEYDTEHGEWTKFGTGLPDKNSGKHYGALSFGDVNADGNVDLIAPIHTRWYSGKNNGIEVYIGDGTGGFSLKYTIEPGESVTEAEVTDLDGDGNLDIAVSTNSAIRVWFGSGSATTWTEMSPSKAGNEITGMDAGDLNKDGLLDLVGCPYFDSRAVRMYVQTSGRTWEEIKFKDVRSEAFGIHINDIDADGNPDVIYGTREQGIKAWLGNSGGSTGGIDFVWKKGSAGLHDSGGHWQQLELQDLTGDGQPELIAANNGANEVFLYINDLPEGWAWIFRGDTESDNILLEEDGLIIGGEPYGANFGDWDADGELDIAACSWGKGVKAWLINGVGFTGGAHSNNSLPIKYPESGKTPPKLIGYDEIYKLRITHFSEVVTAAFGLFLIILFIYKKRKRKTKKRIE